MSQARRAYEALPHPQVVVVGGGFAGLELIKRLEGAPYKVLLLDKHNHHCFQPLLYQVATASLSADSIAHPFRRTVAPMPNVAFRMTRVLAVKPQEKRVVTDHGEFAYDILVLATGSTTNFFGNDQLEREAMQLKSIGQALDIRSDFLQDFEAALYAQDEAGQRRCLNFTIVGGGPTGVELAGALAEIRRTVLKREYRELDSDRMQIWLVDSNERVLKNFSEKASANALKYLEDMGVNVKFGARVTGYDGEVVSFKDGTSMDSNTLIWAAGVKGVTLPGLEAAEVPQANRYHVDRFSRLQGVPDVFALGDVALMAEGTWERGHPQVATAAIQQARLLADNLIRKGGREGVETVHLCGQGQHGHHRTLQGRGGRRPLPHGRSHRLAGLDVRAPDGAGRLPQPPTGADGLGVEVPELEEHHPAHHPPVHPAPGRDSQVVVRSTFAPLRMGQALRRPFSPSHRPAGLRVGDPHTAQLHQGPYGLEVGVGIGIACSPPCSSWPRRGSEALACR